MNPTYYNQSSFTFKCVISLLLAISLLNEKSYAESYKLEHKATCISISASNQIYVGTENGLLCYYERELKPILPFEGKNITAICNDHSKLYIGTQEGEVFQFEHHRVTKILQTQSPISCILMNTQKLLIGTRGNGIYILQNEKKLNFTSANSQLDEYVNDIKINDGNAFVATDAGVSMIDMSNNTISFCVDPKEIKDRIVTCLYFSRKNNLQFGTSLGLVYDKQIQENKLSFMHDVCHSINAITENEIITSNGIFSKKNKQLINTQGYIASDIDLERNVWYITTNELGVHLNQNVSILNMPDVHKIKNVHSIYACGHDIYFTPDVGLGIISKNNQFKLQSLIHANKHIDITSFFQQNDSTLWIGTMGDGLYRYNVINHSFRRISLNESVRSAGILSITGNAENVYVSTLDGTWFSTMLSHDKLHFASLEDAYKTKRSYVYQVKLDRKNRLWMATEGKGIVLFENKQLKPFNPNNLLNAKSFYSVEEDTNGNIYFASDKQGIYILEKNNHILHIDDKSGLYTNSVLALKSSKNYMLVAHDSSCTLVNTSNFKSIFYNFPSNFTTEINSITNWQEKVLVGCDNGILQIEIPESSTSIYPIPNLDNITCNNRHIDTTKSQFSHDENNLIFFLGYNYNNPRIPLYFRYKLNGHNKDWIVTKDKLVLYNLLDAGNYTFHYQIANNPNFQFANEIKYHFNISKPFWKQWWFILASILLLGILLRYIIQYRIKQATFLKEFEQHKQIAEFDALRAQVNPHFLFNSFNSLLQIIEDDKEQAITYTTLLSDLYRNIITHKDKDVIFLEEEINTIVDFVKLHKVNFGDNLQLNIGDFKHETFKIFPLTLQLLVENAIKHNTINTENNLLIEVFVDDIYIIVKNNINKKYASVKGEKIGLENIQKRYSNVGHAQVIIEETPSYFTVKIPLLK